MRKPSLPVRLALLVAGTTLPLIIFATVIVFNNYEQDRQDASQRVVETVRNIRLVLDAEVQRMTGALQVLALTNALRDRDFDGAAWVRTAIRTKALRMIFAGRAGSTPAVTTLLTANNRNVFIMFPPDCATDSSVMYTAMLGINVYSSSRNFKLFFGSCFQFGGAKTVWRFNRGPGSSTLPCH